MDLNNAQSKFIQDWGNLSTNWGIKSTMGRIHALLLISSEPLCADEVMEKLSMSRGNANMNLKSLESWKAIKKKCKAGCRKDYYEAEKDFAKVFKYILQERKRRELDPLLALLEEVNKVQPRCTESNEFCTVTKELGRFAKKADRAINVITSSGTEWISKVMIR